jgi:hypothetical protein
METMLIEVINKKSITLLHELEGLNLIRILKEAQQPKQKLSEKFAGSLHLTNEQYNDFQQSLTESRNEWQDI